MGRDDSMSENKKIIKKLSQEERINRIKDEKLREMIRSILTPRVIDSKTEQEENE